jgi:Zn-dependent protease
MEPAVFRPIPRGRLLALLAGAVGGAILGWFADVSFPFGPLFGAVAAAIATAAAHARGVRVVATPERFEVAGSAAPVSAPWPALRVGFGRTVRPGGGELQRYAIVADPAGRSFAFGVFGKNGPCAPVVGADGRPVEVLDLEGAPILLGVLVQRVPAWQVLPEWLVNVPVPPPLEVAAEVASGEAAGGGGPGASGGTGGAPGATPARSSKPGAGVLTVIAKLGTKLLASAGKIGAGALKAVKGTNLAMAAASAAAYSLIFSWKFALLLMLQLFVHEYGHVFAMKRTGMKVRGMYFIPFLGGLAVTEDAFTSRRQQAYVALNGPLWGSLLCLAPLGLWAATGQAAWAAVAAWWALINLFNLLPITPLDGGRAMNAFASSFSSGLGVAVGALGLAGAVALASAVGFSLLWLVVLVGGLEFFSEARARAGGRALRLLPEPARFGPVHFQYLRAVIGPPPGAGSELIFARDLARIEASARVEPMRKGELLAWGLLYVGLAAGLLAVVILTSHLPGAAEAAQILS